MVWGVGGFCYVERAIFRILGLILGMMSLAKKDLFLATLKCHSGPPPSPITLIPLFFEFLHPKIGGGVPNPNPTPAGGSLGGGCRVDLCHIYMYVIYVAYTPPRVGGAFGTAPGFLACFARSNYMPVCTGKRHGWPPSPILALRVYLGRQCLPGQTASTWGRPSLHPTDRHTHVHG